MEKGTIFVSVPCFLVPETSHELPDLTLLNVAFDFHSPVVVFRPPEWSGAPVSAFVIVKQRHDS